ncbi:MAG: tetratricopeptide repeat protein [Thermodesulfobacteriota bacterium]
MVKGPYMYIRTTDRGGMHAAGVTNLGANLHLLLLPALLVLFLGGCAASPVEQEGVTPPLLHSEMGTEPYAGVFSAREQCESAAAAYGEFLHTWLGAQQAAQYLDAGDGAGDFCFPETGIEEREQRLVRYLCAQACVYLQHEDTQQALQKVLRAQELNQEFIPAQLLRVEVAAAQGNTSGALAKIEQIYAAHPHLNRLNLHMNALHMEQQDFASAAEDLQRYLYIQPDAKAVLLELGRIQARQEDFSDATKTLQTLIDLAPDDPVAYFELGQVLEQRQKFRRALDLYRTAAQTLEHSVQEFEFLQAQLLLEQQEYAAAADVLRSSLAREESVPLRLLYGYALLHLEQYTAAVPELRSAAEGLEFNSMAWLWLGKALALQQQWYDAIAAFQQVDKGDPRTEALLHLAGLYHIVGYNQDAITTLDELLDLGVSDPIMYQHLSYLHMLEQNNSAAVAALEHGLEKYPGNVELNNHLGLLYATLKEYALALKHMEQVALQRPDDAEALNNLAYLYAETEQNLEDAVTLAQTALEQEPRAEFHDTLGWVYVKLGRYAEALEHLRRAHDMQPQNAQILEHLGDLYSAMGQKAQAGEAYFKAQEIHRHNEYLKDKSNPDSMER